MTRQGPAGDPSRVARGAMTATVAAWVALMGVALVWSRTGLGFGLSDHFFISQDVLGLGLAAAFLLLVSRLGASPAQSAWLVRAMRHADAFWEGLRAGGPGRARWTLAVAAGFVVLAAGLGWVFVFDRYPLSMDEFWAQFDARIFAAGQVVAEIPQRWRPFAGALQPMWRLPVAGDTVWASTYLPVNAAMRGLFERVGVGGLAGGAWAAVGLIAMFDVARRLWPERRDAALLAVVLLASSSQLLATAMTPYAMSAHFALNMVWLSLFLRRSAIGQVGAVAVGLAACGLHQLVFHLLFVAPFVAELWWGRRFGRAAVFTLAYAAIGLFWVSYWGWMLPAVGAAAPAMHDDGAGWFARRSLQLLAAARPEAAPLMAQNLCRFFAWQNPILAPLALAGCGVAWRAPSALRPLLLGTLLTTAAMTVVLPYQGHGWGYRYLHGCLGAVALLAAAGWVRLTPGGASTWREGPVVATLSAVFALAVLLPLHLAQAHAFARPYAASSAAIQGARAAVVLVDDAGVPFGQDLVRNDPFLRRQPKVLLLGALHPAQFRELCAGGWTLFDGDDARRFGIKTFPAPATRGRSAALAVLADDPVCRVNRVQASFGRQNMLTSSRFGKAAAMGPPR